MSTDSPPKPPPLPVAQSRVQAALKLGGYFDIKMTLDNRLRRLSKQEAMKYRFHVKNVSPIAQEGPQCGIVAISMVGKYFNIPINVKDIFKYAEDRKYTKAGEMFSTNEMEDVIRNRLRLSSMVLTDPFKDFKLIIHRLLQDNLFIVPYDADCNHYPCCKNGHKAHWAVIIGFAYSLASTTNHDVKEIHLMSEKDIEGITEDNLFLLCLHGKSNNIGVWKLRDLQLSNANLKEVDPTKCDPRKFIFPSDKKLSDSLCNTAILVENVEI